MSLIPKEILKEDLAKIGANAVVERSEYAIRLDKQCATQYDSSYLTRFMIIRFKTKEDLNLYKIAGYFVETPTLVFEVEDGK